MDLNEAAELANEVWSNSDHGSIEEKLSEALLIVIRELRFVKGRLDCVR